ncbi:hypothetical protein Maes01_00261 [Microbulbifer aestuariivivens]|uniref:Uncharacterized protein n=1 Tax=Microbulbifer aestuariivivens TaxID=1908308 RepID=A0ABP9WKI1_9GAMM
MQGMVKQRTDNAEQDFSSKSQKRLGCRRTFSALRDCLKLLSPSFMWS